MNEKSNIEELKSLIPDYINGALNEPDRIRVEKALLESGELRQFHREISSVFDIIGKMEFLEPAPQYWSNLLPNIHRRIDQKKAGKPARLIWRYLVPAAAVILIFIIYRIITAPEAQMTRDDKKIEQIQKEDKHETGPPEEMKKDATADEDRLIEKKKESPKKFKERKDIKEGMDEKSIVGVEEEKEALSADEILPVDAEDMSLFAAGSPGGVDEDLSDEMEKLGSAERDKILVEIGNIEL